MSLISKLVRDQLAIATRQDDLRLPSQGKVDEPTRPSVRGKAAVQVKPGQPPIPARVTTRGLPVPPAAVPSKQAGMFQWDESGAEKMDINKLINGMLLGQNEGAPQGQMYPDYANGGMGPMINTQPGYAEGLAQFIQMYGKPPETDGEFAELTAIMQQSQAPAVQDQVLQQMGVPNGPSDMDDAVGSGAMRPAGQQPPIPGPAARPATAPVGGVSGPDDMDDAVGSGADQRPIGSRMDDVINRTLLGEGNTRGPVNEAAPPDEDAGEILTELTGTQWDQDVVDFLNGADSNRTEQFYDAIANGAEPERTFAQFFPEYDDDAADVANRIRGTQR